MPAPRGHRLPRQRPLLQRRPQMGVEAVAHLVADGNRHEEAAYVFHHAPVTARRLRWSAAVVA